MQVVWREPSVSEIDYETLWLVTSVSGAVGAAVWLRLGLPWPRCAFLALTGHPCLTCGATRAAIQFGQGHLLAAWRLNPLVSLAYCGIALFDFYALLALVLQAPRLRLVHFSAFEKKTARITIAALLAINWAYLLVLA